jgi:hypothetical protein
MDYYSVAVIIWFDPALVANGLLSLNPQIVWSDSVTSILNYVDPNP